MSGSLHELLRRDHERLGALLRRTIEDPHALDLAAYESFRAGILRHIAMEEKVLFKEASLRTGAPLSKAKRLRADHAALASLTVPTPTRAIVAAIEGILLEHDALEEELGGVYEECERAIGADAGAVAERLEAVPDVPLGPHVDAPHVLRHVEDLLRARGLSGPR